jgi:hypothetical protein
MYDNSTWLYYNNYNNIETNMNEMLVEAIPVCNLSSSSNTPPLPDIITRDVAHILILRHISGSTRDKQWCLNNFYAFIDNVIISTEVDDLYHKWLNVREEVAITTPSGVNKIAFATQDIVIANVSINASKNIDIKTIHWSNASHRDGSGWRCEDNNNHKHWSYNVVHINENLDLTYTRGRPLILNKANR